MLIANLTLTLPTVLIACFKTYMALEALDTLSLTAFVKEPLLWNFIQNHFHGILFQNMYVHQHFLIHYQHSEAV